MVNKRGQIQPIIQETPKKSKWWLWLIIILVLFGIGIGIYVLFSGGPVDPTIVNSGSSIPQPPALPSG